MRKKEIINVEGTRYFLQYMVATNIYEIKEKPNNICALTQKTIKPGDEITLVMNNFETFPNKVVLTEEIEGLGKETAIKIIKGRYEEYLRFKEEYKEWYGY